MLHANAMHLDTSSASLPLLTPRQNRLESTIVRALLTHGTRSELRDAVHQLVDFSRLQGIPLEGGVACIRAVAMRATHAHHETSDVRHDSHRSHRPCSCRTLTTELILVASSSTR